MKPVKSYLVLVLVFFLVGGCAAFHLKNLEFYAQMINSIFLESSPFGGGNVAKSEKQIEHAQLSVQGKTMRSSLYDFITYEDKRSCSLVNEDGLEDGTNADGSRKSSLRVKCVSLKGNGTLYMLDSLQMVVNVLASYGNSTKRNQPGSCVVMLFYTSTCIHSATAAPHFNALARHFPDLAVAAVDAYEFHVLNAEFGIVGLPTIMFFYQGRPLVKFNDTITLSSLANFVTRHSGIEPRLANPRKGKSKGLYYKSYDLKGPLLNEVKHKTDYWLYLAWIFIIICTCYYFSKSTLFAQIMEMIKRNWRESAAHNS